MTSNFQIIQKEIEEIEEDNICSNFNYINEKDKEGNIPFFYALKSGGIKIINFFLNLDSTDFYSTNNNINF